MVKLNEVLGQHVRVDWEAKQEALRASKPRRGGRQKWDKNHGKVVRDGRRGIDWYRFQKYILIPKLICFAQECT